MGIQRKIAVVGLGKQTAKGAALANPVYQLGLIDGRAFNVPIDQEYEERTLPGGASDRFSPGINRVGSAPGAAFKVRAFPKSIGLLSLMALGGTVVTGTNPYTHTDSPALTLPYGTLFAKYGPGDYEKLPDVLVDELTISWSGRQPLEAEVTVLGLAPAINAASWAATVDETLNAYITPIGATLRLDVDGAVLAAAQVTAASMRIANNLDPVELSRSILPDDYVPGSQVVEGTITLKPDNLNEWKAVITGSPAGTAVQETVVYGSLDLATLINANNSLKLTANRVAFMCDFPEADSSAGGAEIQLAYQVVRPTDGSAACQAVTVNDVATY